MNQRVRVEILIENVHGCTADTFLKEEKRLVKINVVAPHELSELL
jgi:hypothetical protein